MNADRYICYNWLNTFAILRIFFPCLVPCRERGVSDFVTDIKHLYVLGAAKCYPQSLFTRSVFPISAEGLLKQFITDLFMMYLDSKYGSVSSCWLNSVDRH